MYITISRHFYTHTSSNENIHVPCVEICGLGMLEQLFSSFYAFLDENGFKK